MGCNNLFGCFGNRRSHRGHRHDRHDWRRDDRGFGPGRDRHRDDRGFGPGRDRDFDRRHDRRRSSCCRSWRDDD